MTVTDAMATSRSVNPTFVYRAATYRAEFVRMLKREMVLDDDDADAVCSAIIGAARTGKPGDVKVWVSPLDGVSRIRTGEWNASAV